MPLFDFLSSHWLFITAAVNFLVALIVSAHVLVTKRDLHAAIAWVGLIWLTPIIGAVLYYLLGINRIQRRAKLLRKRRPRLAPVAHWEGCPIELLEKTLGNEGQHLGSLAVLVRNVSRRPLLSGNTIVPLQDGDEAFPAMLRAIDEAKRSVALGTYIFDDDRVGKLFVEALQRAVARNVEVRVLIDDMGARYSWPSVVRRLRAAGITCATFLPPSMTRRFQHWNLRTHRKMLVVDGTTGFTGGINIRQGHWLATGPKHPIRDLHFRVVGPVVSQIQEVFADDWLFCDGEILEGEAWFPPMEASGGVLARGVSDGPDEDSESFRLTLLGAIACAESSIRVVTPYFLPDAPLITALNVAALRGVSVDIVLPKKSNIRFVQWASTSLLWQLVQRGCRVWLSPPPFDHAKLLVVDELACFVGSSNWDPRSLRLNFEFNLECYDSALATELSRIVDARIDASHRLTLAELDGRPFLIKLRDGIARLPSPYL